MPDRHHRGESRLSLKLLAEGGGIPRSRARAVLTGPEVGEGLGGLGPDPEFRPIQVS